MVCFVFLFAHTHRHTHTPRTNVKSKKALNFKMVIEQDWNLGSSILKPTQVCVHMRKHRKKNYCKEYIHTLTTNNLQKPKHLITSSSWSRYFSRALHSPGPQSQARSVCTGGQVQGTCDASSQTCQILRITFVYFCRGVNKLLKK